jgi:hypothetical protein
VPQRSSISADASGLVYCWARADGNDSLGVGRFPSGSDARGLPALCERTSIMKKLFLGVLLTTSAVIVFAQGTVLFDNLDTSAGVNAPVYESDGVTKLSGPQFQAELLGGPSSSGLASISTTGFFTGQTAGYFSGGPQVVPGVIPGNYAWVEVRAWNTVSGASFLQSQASGLPNSWWQSSTFAVIAGGETVNPTPPAPLTGLGTSPVFLNGVPEPSTSALVGLGSAAALLQILRRKRSRGLSDKRGQK